MYQRGGATVLAVCVGTPIHSAERKLYVSFTVASTEYSERLNLSIQAL